jgi:hypothetical protein
MGSIGDNAETTGARFPHRSPPQVDFIWREDSRRGIHRDGSIPRELLAIIQPHALVLHEARIHQMASSAEMGLVFRSFVSLSNPSGHCRCPANRSKIQATEASKIMGSTCKAFAVELSAANEARSSRREFTF